MSIKYENGVLEGTEKQLDFVNFKIEEIKNTMRLVRGATNEEIFDTVMKAFNINKDVAEYLKDVFFKASPESVDAAIDNCCGNDIQSAIVEAYKHLTDGSVLDALTKLQREYKTNDIFKTYAEVVVKLLSRVTGICEYRIVRMIVTGCDSEDMFNSMLPFPLKDGSGNHLILLTDLYLNNLDKFDEKDDEDGEKLSIHNISKKHLECLKSITELEIDPAGLISTHVLTVLFDYTLTQCYELSSKNKIIERAFSGSTGSKGNIASKIFGDVTPSIFFEVDAYKHIMYYRHEFTEFFKEMAAKVDLDVLNNLAWYVMDRETNECPIYVMDKDVSTSFVEITSADDFVDYYCGKLFKE